MTSMYLHSNVCMYKMYGKHIHALIMPIYCYCQDFPFQVTNIYALIFLIILLHDITCNFGLILFVTSRIF